MFLVLAACLAGAAGSLAAPGAPAAQEASQAPRGFHSFGADQTIVDINQLEWALLDLEGLPPGAEIVVLRGDLAKGASELLLRLPPGYEVPNHSHTSDEVYVWLQGDFTYVSNDSDRQDLGGQAYISLPGDTSHALVCGDEPCVLYLRYSRPFDLHVHPMPR